ncbi:diguanylate cyclase [Rhodoferax sp. 4810]|uniref:Diguanylate cyclase n=1 Tax=Thiospirillum jenense TaxID=1653858 RepID=A0A839HDV0_9GAMM|nr:diguanylate cyclase [Thiospirillum jenense]MBB1073856.1 diguanylate cyclase [Rhodoferax jenense]MBB1125189.1 diguanylate cyclase [Thiospirillum jenense]
MCHAQNIIHTRVFILFALLLSLTANATSQLDTVTLQLKWKHQFQFAGYYAAQAKGFYQEVGLDVRIIEAAPGVDSTHEVVAGRAQFGVGTSELILNRYRGEPVLVLGVIFQHSPLSLVTLTDSGIEHIHKLVGHQLMIEPSSAELFAYLYQEGFTQKAFVMQHHSFDLNDLINGQTDAMSVYSTDEVYELKQLNRTYNLFSPRMSGIDFYGDNFFTTETELEQHPQRVKAFREATLQGWRYAMQNPDEIIQLIYQKYSQRHSIAHLQFEAQAMRDLMRPELIDPGYMNIGRWQHIAKTYHYLGMLPERFNVEQMLYIPNSELDLQRLKRQLYYTMAILILVSLIVLLLFYFYRRAKISEVRLNTIFNYTPLGLMILNNKNQVVNWNFAAEKTFLWKSAEVIGKTVLLIVPTRERDAVQTVLNTVHQEQQVIHHENINLKKDGQEILCEWINAPFKSRIEKSNFIICIARDITEKRALQKQLEQAALYDNLTGLPNRVFILTQLKKALALAARHQTKLGVLFFDLNGFKEINDTLGHQLGDLLLQVFATRLQQSIRETDYVGRLAGDEFLMILQDVGSLDNAQKIVEKLHANINQPCQLNNEIIEVSASVGIAIYPDHAIDADALIYCADKNMYQAKQRQAKSHIAKRHR